MKKQIALLLCIALLLGSAVFASCGKKEDPDKEETAASESVADTETKAAETEAVETEAVETKAAETEAAATEESKDEEKGSETDPLLGVWAYDITVDALFKAGAIDLDAEDETVKELFDRCDFSGITVPLCMEFDGAVVSVYLDKNGGEAFVDGMLDALADASLDMIREQLKEESDQDIGEEALLEMLGVDKAMFKQLLTESIPREDLLSKLEYTEKMCYRLDGEKFYFYYDGFFDESDYCLVDLTGETFTLKAHIGASEENDPIESLLPMTFRKR